MPTVEELIKHVIDTVEDPGITEDDVLVKLNDAQQYVSEEILLPALDYSEDVAALLGEISIDLPDSYGRGLYKCQVVGQVKQPIVLTQMSMLLERYPEIFDAAPIGDIEFVCVHNDKLYFAPVPGIPPAMKIFFYRQPTPLVSTEQEPDLLPPNYHKTILAQHAIREFFDAIEDGMEGEKVNTRNHTAKLDQAMEKYDFFTTQGRNRPAPPRDRKAWI